VNGNLYFLGSAGAVNVSFRYGTTRRAYSQRPRRPWHARGQADLTGLIPTAYISRATAAVRHRHQTEQRYHFARPASVSPVTQAVTPAPRPERQSCRLGTATTVNVSLIRHDRGRAYPHDTAQEKNGTAPSGQHQRLTPTPPIAAGPWLAAGTTGEFARRRASPPLNPPSVKPIMPPGHLPQPP
jgi:hypothetical protein